MLKLAPQNEVAGSRGDGLTCRKVARFDERGKLLGCYFYQHVGGCA